MIEKAQECKADASPSIANDEGGGKNTETTPSRNETMEASNSGKIVEWSRHPLVVTFVGFIFTGIIGGLLTWSLNYHEHMRDKEMSMRDASISAVKDISELVNDRRVRGKLVTSSIQRKAPEVEVTARKSAYDEALVRWNIKMPGDLLRMRAGLQWALSKNNVKQDWSRLRYEKYIDALINSEMLFHLNENTEPTTFKPGLFKIMDECLTKAFDAYRSNLFTNNTASLEILSACKFTETHSRSVSCFGRMAEILYKIVNYFDILNTSANEAMLLKDCSPPELAPENKNCCDVSDRASPVGVFADSTGSDLFKWRFGLNALKLNSASAGN